MQARGFSCLLNGKIDPAKQTVASPMLAFCGVGNPEAFFNGLRKHGYTLRLQRTFPDHHTYTQRDLDALVAEAKRAGIGSLVTTAKDAVKLTTLEFPLPCYVFDIEILIEDEVQLTNLILEAIGTSLL
jgi:tetraacyldisaccharide 4'-kinase